MRRIVLLAVLMTHSVVGGALAQAIPSPGPGDQVRLETTALKGVFDVVEWTAPSLTVRDPKTMEVIPVPVESIRRIEVRDGQQSRGRSALRGLGIGFVIGAAAGAILGFADGDDSADQSLFIWRVPTRSPRTAEEKAMLFGVTIGATAGVIGGVAGAANPPRHWTPVTAPAWLGLIPPGRDGFGVRLSLGV